MKKHGCLFGISGTSEVGLNQFVLVLVLVIVSNTSDSIKLVISRERSDREISCLCGCSLDYGCRSVEKMWN